MSCIPAEVPNVSEEGTASIFKVEEWAKQDTDGM
jgi:hypothetical protein